MYQECCVVDQAQSESSWKELRHSRESEKTHLIVKRKIPAQLLLITIWWRWMKPAGCHKDIWFTNTLFWIVWFTVSTNTNINTNTKICDLRTRGTFHLWFPQIQVIYRPLCCIHELLCLGSFSHKYPHKQQSGAGMPEILHKNGLVLEILHKMDWWYIEILDKQ